MSALTVLIILSALTAVGVALFAITLASPGLARSLHETFLIKYAMELMSAAVAAPTVLRLYRPEDDWLAPSLVGLGCFVAWRAVLLRAEQASTGKRKALEEEIDAQSARCRALENEGKARTSLLMFHLAYVEQKRDSVVQARARQGNGDRRITTAEDGLAPGDCITLLLQHALFWARQLPIAGADRASFRIAYYAEADNHLARRAVAVSTGSSSIPRQFSSAEQHREPFRLDNTDSPSHAVLCVQKNIVLVVCDCKAAHEDKAEQFRYLRDEQADYLCSLVACPVCGAVSASGQPIRGAIVLDADQPGFFSEEHSDILQLALRSFAARISLEMALISVLCKRT